VSEPWWKANGRGCADCQSPAAWCRACMAEADRDRLSRELEAMTGERDEALESLAVEREQYKADKEMIHSNHKRRCEERNGALAACGLALSSVAELKRELGRVMPVYLAARHRHSPHVAGAFVHDGVRIDANNRLQQATMVAANADPDDWDRCAVCGWDLAETIEDGCTRGNCSHRPRPGRLYSPDRAAREALTTKPGDS
jgi:hypothetical protein